MDVSPEHCDAIVPRIWHMTGETLVGEARQCVLIGRRARRAAGDDLRCEVLDAAQHLSRAGVGTQRGRRGAESEVAQVDVVFRLALAVAPSDERIARLD